MYGVAVSLGLAFILTYPVPIRPVDTSTCPGAYVVAGLGESPSELLSPAA